MALRYLPFGLFMLFVTVTSVRVDCNWKKEYRGCLAEIEQKDKENNMCGAGSVANLITDCVKNCTDYLRNDAWKFYELHDAIVNSQENCTERNARACGISELLQCTLAIVSFAQNVNSLGIISPNDAMAVCRYVNQYAGNINTCQALISDCVTLGLPSSAFIANQIRDVTGYVLIATGQSCVCTERTANLINTFNNDPAINCTTAQSSLSSLIDQTLVCRSALPATPYPGFPVFNVDFKVAAEGMVRGGAAAKVAACSLMFVPTPAAALATMASLSTLLLMAVLIFHFLGHS